MKKSKWETLSPEEKKEIRARQAKAKRLRDLRSLEKDEMRAARYASDERAQHMKPGDWLRYPDGLYGRTDLLGKIVRFKDWDDDGHNHKRAARNKHIIVEVEPHLHDEPKVTFAKLGDFYPLNPMQVIALAAKAPQ